ncbi:hypothetical protein GCM10007276_33690 [Agaricicola taiwanensis]|uniref:Nutrient deprivation-induced protein n=1 Tax=Agaricicola taiwanensis TaxID=591372 RepID=A0A8J2YMV4_9RHOB|nr:hypothetical protein [Agaricicola taiwanensis]GGE53871.1 hypothetical protein GCM10007276_33690 [Agaricicola taiwanensis]
MSSTDTSGSPRQASPENDETVRVHTEGFAGDSASRGSQQGSSGANFRDDAQKAREKIGEGASSAARDMRARAASFADEQKEYGADRLEGVAHAVDSAASDLEKEMPQAAGLVRDAARGLNDFSRNLRERSTGDMLHSVSDFARREPAAFFGGAVLAGFVLSRFLKSTADRPVDTSSQSQGFRSQDRGRQSSTRPDVARPDERGSWPEMEEADVSVASSSEVTWDRPADSPSSRATAGDKADQPSVSPRDVSATEPGMGYTNPNASRQ